MPSPTVVGYNHGIMITKVEFENFKALRDVSVDLERLTVLVGPNGSGKTSVLEGLYYLSEFGRDRSRGRSGPQRLSLRHCTSGTDRLMLKGGDDGNCTTITANSENLSVASEREDGKNQFTVDTKAYDRGAEAKHGGPPDFGPAMLLRLDINQLMAPSYSDEEAPTMKLDGEGLPSVLNYLLSNEPNDYAKLKDTLRFVIPAFRDMRFPRAKVVRSELRTVTVDDKTVTIPEKREYWGNSIVFDMEGAPDIGAEMTSEGTLLVLAILTALLGPGKPRLFLLDDIDRALHPKAQQALVKCLREFMHLDPNLQIVATSHSPYLLHYLEPQEVRLMTTDENGFAACGRLDEHPDFEKWKEEMSPGEMWSLFGESWLVPSATGGRQS